MNLLDKNTRNSQIKYIDRIVKIDRAPLMLSTFFKKKPKKNHLNNVK